MAKITRNSKKAEQAATPEMNTQQAATPEMNTQQAASGEAVVQNAAPEEKAPKEKKVTKASIVRERIALAKVNGEGKEVVVQYAIDELGFDKPLAKVYVNNNWDKVVVEAVAEPEAAPATEAAPQEQAQEEQQEEQKEQVTEEA